MNKELSVAEKKNPAWRRHWIYRPMLIEASITKENFFEGDLRTDEQTLLILKLIFFLHILSSLSKTVLAPLTKFCSTSGSRSFAEMADSRLNRPIAVGQFGKNSLLKLLRFLVFHIFYLFIIWIYFFLTQVTLNIFTTLKR